MTAFKRKASPKALPKPSAKPSPKPLPNQEQEQEQERGRGEKLPEVPPDDATHHQCATWFWEQLGQVYDSGTFTITAESIRLYASERKSKPNLAAVEILARARLATDRGETVNRFWFQDGKHKNTNGSGKGDGGKANPHEMPTVKFSIYDDPPGAPK